MSSPNRRRIAARCSVPGCKKQVQTRRLCKAHGGVRCRGPGCTKLAQSRGLCVAHGGGRRCAFDGCAKLAQYKGLCLSHGGGRRCGVAECQKFVQVRGHCKAHLKKLEASKAARSPTTTDNSFHDLQPALTSTESKLAIAFVVNPLDPPTSYSESPRMISFPTFTNTSTLEYSTDFDGQYFSIP